jgi:DNA polymerase III epsilon subunit-like protein
VGLAAVGAVALLLTAGLAAGASAWRARRASWPSDVPLARLDFVAVDIETTGLDPATDTPVALAAIPFVDGRPRLEHAFARLVNPGRPIPLDAQAIHGISDARVRDCPGIAAVLPDFLATCRERPIVAHTAAFDLTILGRAAKAARLPALTSDVLDIGVLAHALFPSWWDLSLEGLGRLVGVEPTDRHTAIGDAVTAGAIFRAMLPLLEQRGIRTLWAALALQRRSALIPGGPGPAGGELAGP